METRTIKLTQNQLAELREMVSVQIEFLEVEQKDEEKQKIIELERLLEIIEEAIISF